MGELTHSTRTSVTVQAISRVSSKAPRNSNDVDFEVKYPEGFAGNKPMPEGVTVVSREVAELFEQKGYGRIVGNDSNPQSNDEVSDTPGEMAEQSASPGEEKKEQTKSTTSKRNNRK